MSALRKIIDFQSVSGSIVAQDTDRIIEASIKHNIRLSDYVLAKPVVAQRSIEELLFDNRAELKRITAQYGLSHFDKDLRAQLFKQIDWILDDEEGEQLDNFADQESFKTLIKFVLNTNPVNAPYLNLADDGHLIATWITGANKLRLECFANDYTQWFISCEIDGEAERISGEAASLQRLLDRLEPFKKAGWFKPNG
jgi:hypothetical protein